MDIIYLQQVRGDNSKTTLTSWKSKFWRIVQNFTPSWFAITMGTGMVSILLYKLPYNSTWLYWLSVILFILDIALFGIFTTVSALRYMCYPEIWRAMIKHPTESLFLGTFPMGIGIIIEMIINICVPIWGPWVTILAWALWWIETVMSIKICLYLPFIIMSVHKTDISSITTLWLLPIVSTIVCGATGAMIAGALSDITYALWTLAVSYILWGMGVPLAIFTLVLYYHRLMMHKIPPPEVISSVFLPLGPLGEGGFGIMKMGQVSLVVFPATNTLIPPSGQIMYIFGFLIALLMWGFGIVWLVWAVASFGKSKSTFNMGWWSIIFATGVFTGSMITLGEEMPSRFFKVLGTVLTAIIGLFWFVVSWYTVRGTISGELFTSACLVDPETLGETLPIGSRPI